MLRVVGWSGLPGLGASGLGGHVAGLCRGPGTAQPHRRLSSLRTGNPWCKYMHIPAFLCNSRLVVLTEPADFVTDHLTVAEHEISLLDSFDLAPPEGEGRPPGTTDRSG